MSSSYNFNSMANLAPISAGNSLSRPGSRASSPHAANPHQHFQHQHQQYGGPNTSYQQQAQQQQQPPSAYAAVPMIPGEACSFGPNFYSHNQNTQQQQQHQPHAHAAPTNYVTQSAVAATGGNGSSFRSVAPPQQHYNAPNANASVPPPMMNHDASAKLRELASAKAREVEEMDHQMRQLEIEEAQLLERQKMATKVDAELPAMNNHIIELWQSYYDSEQQERAEEAARQRDPTHCDEEYILAQRIQAAELRVEAARRNALEVSHRKQQASDAVNAMSHVHTLRSQQEEELEKLSKGFEHMEARRVALVNKCGRPTAGGGGGGGYTELEETRVAAVKKHLYRLDQEARADGEQPSTTPQLRATVSSTSAPFSMVEEDDDMPPTTVLEDDLLDGLGDGGMDSICLSFNTGNKRRRLESSEPRQQHPSSSLLA